MKPSIVVSSNCQTAGIAAAMRQFFPRCDIVPLILTEKTNDDSVFQRVLQHATMWFTIGKTDVVQRLNLSKVQVINIPTIVFDAFHPDITYALNSETKSLTKIHYNSNIAVWAYNNNLDERTASLLYNFDVFDQLGYFARWPSATQLLQSSLLACDLDFRSLYLYVKRRGNFMYSINHPKQFVLTRLAQLAASKAHMKSSMLDANLEIVDGYTDTQWPVYPDIGEFYAVPSSYVWRFGPDYIDGLIPYLRFAFKNYEREGIRRGNLKIGSGTLAEHTNKVLSRILA